MSWNLRMLGPPANLATALEAAGAGMTEAQAAEYAVAKPHLLALVAMNVTDPPTPVRLEASGNSNTKDGKTTSMCRVLIEPFTTTLV